MNRVLAGIVVTLVAAGATVADDPPPPPALKGLDPVELTAGKEVAGDPKLAVRRGRFLYTFATPATRAAFEKEPERYAIQFGGACMRMGPLAGGGHPDRFHVAAGRIYVFASEGCRNSFKADPHRFIDLPDPPPAGSDEAVTAAAVLLRKAVAAAGGDTALADLATFQVRYKVTLRQGEKEYPSVQENVTAFPATFARWDVYEKSKYGWVLRLDGGYLSWEKGEPVDAAVRAHMTREFYREPLHLLRAWRDGAAKAVYLGGDTVGDVVVDRVAVAAGGATTTLSIDPLSGRVLRAAYRGRTPLGVVPVETDYSSFRAVGGLTVPHGVTTRHNGAPAAQSVRVETIRVNAKIDPEWLKRPG